MPVRKIMDSHANDAVALEARLTKVEGAVTNIAVSVEGLGRQMSNLATELTVQRKPNWTALGLVLAVITGLWALGTQPISQRVNMVEQNNAQLTNSLSQLGANVAVSAVNDAQSLTDRHKLNSQLERVIEGQATNRADIAHLHMVSAEVETQIKAIENYAAIKAANDEQKFAIIFEKTFNQRYPSDSIHTPTIAQPKNITPGR